MLTDSHCHLDSKDFNEDRDAVIQRALEAGVTRMVAIGTGEGPPDLEAGLRLADRYPCFLATVGVHPHDSSKVTPETYKHLEALLQHPKTVAMGEIGLDYHHGFSPQATQHAVFIEQMGIAAAARKPIVIHTREAWDDTFTLLERHWKPHGLPGIMHCFSGGPEEARRSLDLGFYLAFGGVVTYPRALNVQEAARMVPLERILVETDAPYLAPVPRRGKRNEPALMVHTAAKLAELRGISAGELAAATSQNFDRVAGIG
jgi:TatD DNase family protein